MNNLKYIFIELISSLFLGNIAFAESMNWHTGWGEGSGTFLQK